MFFCFLRRPWCGFLIGWKTVTLTLTPYGYCRMLGCQPILNPHHCRRTRTRTNTNPNGTEANAAGRSGNARALRKQSKCGMIQEGEGHWPNSSKNLQKARNLWVLRTPQNNKEEGARAKKLVTCGTRSPLGRGQSVPFSAQGAYCSAPEP